MLNRFHGKVIKSADELRGMDTTIWRIRPRAAQDRDEEILLTTRFLSEPISAESRDLQSPTILHITDPHFATGANRNKHVWSLESETGRTTPTMVEAVARALGDRRVGLVVITGDLTFTGKPDEFREAATAITRLLGLLNVDKDRLVIIPGNHDIQWTKTEAYIEQAEVTEAPEAAKKNYQDFYAHVYAHAADATLAMGRRFALPSGLILEIAAVNSSSLETGKNFLAGMGRIEESALEEVALRFRWGEPSAALRLLCIHHHLVLTENVEPVKDYYRGYGLAIDAPKVLRSAASKGVHLVLHGHKHRAFVWSSSVYELPEHAQTKWELGRVSIVGGGSCGSVETESRSNYFNFLQFNGAESVLEMFRATNAGAFSKMMVWKAAVELDPGKNRLSLNDWRAVAG
ncbi:MAG: metallophosphoesterase [Bryobacteraceae bacterium]